MGIIGMLGGLLRGKAVLTMAWAVGLGLGLGFVSGPARAGGLETEWVRGHASKSRLIGGSLAHEKPGQFLAGVEVQLKPGWKTYWRNPGEAGGVPPEFDWKGSQNVRDVSVLYPAPHRFVDESGQTIGYKGEVIFPVRVAAKDPSKPVTLRLNFNYGICERMCIPVEADMSLKYTAGQAFALPVILKSALQAVPRSGNSAIDSDPKLVSYQTRLDGAQPRFEFKVRDPAGGKAADLFVETTDGSYVPMARRLPDGPDGLAVFEVDLSQGADPADLKGNTLVVTLVGDAGQSEARIKLD